MLLDVAHENARARRFYARMGFRPTGEVGAMPWDASVTEETLALDLPGRHVMFTGHGLPWPAGVVGEWPP